MGSKSWSALQRASSYVVSCLLISFCITLPASAEGLEAEKAFAHLASLEGTWKGAPDASGMPESVEASEEAPPPMEVQHEIVVSANGSVVMETMNPGTDHEMINMYHLDGEELVLTHYCAGGNQPTMKLDREKSTGDRFVFDFTGGSNFDPAVDGHIHSAELVFKGEGQMESRWNSYNAGSPAGTMAFHLKLAEQSSE